MAAVRRRFKFAVKMSLFYLFNGKKLYFFGHTLGKFVRLLALNQSPNMLSGVRNSYGPTKWHSEREKYKFSKYSIF